MGFAVAEAAVEAGARVTLVAGPVRLDTPRGVERHDVRSALQMRDAVMAAIGSADIFIGVAAVADFRPAHVAEQKIKKDSGAPEFELLANPDIIAEVAALDGGPLTIGFAAETEKLREHAMEKLSRKRLDMIAANRVGQEGSGFEVEENEILLLTARGERPLGRGNKRQLARRLIEEVAEVLGPVNRP